MNYKIIKRSFAVFTVAAVVTACVICQSRYCIQNTEYELNFALLPAEFDGLRIVQLSDLHGSSFGRDNSRLVEAVKEQKPDIIAITGDMAENDEELVVFENLLKGISGVAPIYYVSGNHEWYKGYINTVREMLEKYGVRSLENEYELISRGESSIVIAGVDDPNGRADMIKPDAFAERLRQEYPDEFTLLLGHRNYWVEEYPALPVDLILCGHAHGGIIRLPFIGGLLSTKHKLIAEYENGLYSGEQFTMLVSRGLGNSILVPRMFNTPQIVTTILRSGQS